MKCVVGKMISYIFWNLCSASPSRGILSCSHNDINEFNERAASGVSPRTYKPLYAKRTGVSYWESPVTPGVWAIHLCVPIHRTAPRGQLTNFSVISSEWFRHRVPVCAMKQLRIDARGISMIKSFGSSCNDPKYHITLPHYFRSYDDLFDLSGVIPVYSRTSVLGWNTLIGASFSMPHNDPKVS